MNNEAGSGRTAAATAPSRPRKSATVQRDVTTSFSAGENKLRGVTVTLFVVAAALMLWELYAIARNNQVTVSDILRAANYESGGLLALSTLALIWHLWGPIPRDWQGDR